MSDYKVYAYIDELYEVVDSRGDQVFRGTLVEVHAWLELKDKGYL
jgi:hypothetical protein